MLSLFIVLHHGRNQGAGQPNQAPMSKCTGCGFARYCNRECQKSAWSDHKLECNAIKCTNPRESSDKTRMVARIVWKNLRDGAKTDAIVDIKVRSGSLCSVVICINFYRVFPFALCGNDKSYLFILKAIYGGYLMVIELII